MTKDSQKQLDEALDELRRAIAAVPVEYTGLIAILTNVISGLVLELPDDHPRREAIDQAAAALGKLVIEDLREVDLWRKLGLDDIEGLDQL